MVADCDLMSKHGEAEGRVEPREQKISFFAVFCGIGLCIRYALLGRKKYSHKR
jgi:hypothetical protein